MTINGGDNYGVTKISLAQNKAFFTKLLTRTNKFGFFDGQLSKPVDFERIAGDQFPKVKA